MLSTLKVCGYTPTPGSKVVECWGVRRAGVRGAGGQGRAGHGPPRHLRRRLRRPLPLRLPGRGDLLPSLAVHCPSRFHHVAQCCMPEDRHSVDFLLSRRRISFFKMYQS